MVQRNMRDSRSILFDVLKSHASTDSDEATLHRVYGDMLLDGLTDGAIELQLASMLIDGLRWGNWPWTVHKVTDAQEVTAPDVPQGNPWGPWGSEGRPGA